MIEPPTPGPEENRAFFSTGIVWALVPVFALGAVLLLVLSGGPHPDAAALHDAVRSASAVTLLATSFVGFLYFSVRLISKVLRGEMFRIPAKPPTRLEVRGELGPVVSILGTLLLLWLILQLS